ncbi:MAG TPA: hypothetical protein VIN71_12275 [Pseudomonadales bacterium]
MKKHVISTGLIGLFFCLPAAAELRFNGFVEAELRLYPGDGLLDEQKQALPSVAVQPELTWRSQSRQHNLRAVAFGRLSDSDGERDHADLRQAYYLYAGSGWQVQAGVNKVFWGVTESAHLVDIINQTDTVEAFNGEEKLGQPMIGLGLEQGWGNLDIYILPYFRERQFPDGPERFRLSLAGQPINYDHDNAWYEDKREEKHVDVAARWWHWFGGFDIGLSVFQGTNREPIPILVQPDLLNPADSLFGSYYEQLQQIGIEMQYIYDSWAFKYESASKWLDSGNYHSVATGFEYTLSGLGESGYDLGLLVEYLWNNRDDVSVKDPSLKAMGLDENTAPPQLVDALENNAIPGSYLSPLENDVFVGTRFALNDIASTEFVAGLIIDLDDQTTSASFEGSTRIGNSIRIALNVYLFENVDENSAFYAFRKDDQIEAKFTWYF